MPTYCHSCPYNLRFCKGLYIEGPTCPHGYSPLRRDGQLRSEISLYDIHLGSPKKGRVFEPSILILIGKSAANRDDYQTAQECYEKVLEVEPGNTEAAFLLKRINYILDSNTKELEDIDLEAEPTPEPEKRSIGMLPLQEEKRISIRPKQQFDIDPNIINKDQEKVYHVEDDEDGMELQEVSKHVAQEIKKSSKREKRNMGLAAGIIVILMMIALLWYFGYLRF